MTRGIALSGLVGLAVGLLIFLGAAWIAAELPTLLQGPFVVAVAFALLLMLSLAEIPMMVMAMRHMLRSPSTPQLLVSGVNMGYTAFAPVYGAIFVLLTRENLGGLALACIGILRFASGAWIK